MQNELEKLFRHSAVFLVGLIFQRAARLLLLPLYWTAFPPELFGLLDLFEIFIWVMTLTFVFSLPTTYMKFRRVDVNEGACPEVLRGTTFVLSVVGIALLILAMIVLETPLSWFFFKGRHPRLYAIAGATIIANISFLMMLSSLRAHGRAVAYTAFSSIQFLLLMFFNIYFIKYRGMGLEGVLWGWVFGWGLPALIYGVVNARGLQWRFDVAVARRLLRFALPLVPFVLLSYFIQISGRLFLQHFRDLEAVQPEAVGILAAANRVALIILLVCVTPFQTAWGYLGLDFLRRTDAKEIFKRAFTYLLGLGLWSFLLVSAVGREVIILFGKTYYMPALPYVDTLTAGYLMLLFFYWANIALVGRNMTVRVLLISIVPFAISIAGGFVVIPHFGVGGACGVFLAAMAVHAGLTAFCAQRLVGFGFEKGRVVKILCVFAIVYLLGQRMLSSFGDWRVAIAIAEVAVFPLLVAASGFLTRGEIQRLRDLRRKVVGARADGD